MVGSTGSATTGTAVRALESSRVETKSDNDFWNEMPLPIRAIIGAEGGRNVIVNAQSGLVLVRALPSELRQVDEFLHAMQGVVARQVMLEAKIIEVQLRDTFSTGVNWAAFGGNNGRVVGGVISPGTTLSRTGPPVALSLPVASSAEVVKGTAGIVGPIAEPMFKEFLLAFELTSVLLLVAIIGAVVLAKKRSAQ